jgi:hypothetical protein
VLLLSAPVQSAPRFSGRKVLYLDSYHPEYEPGILQRKAVRAALEPEGVTVREYYLDEKRRGDEESLRKAADGALREIRSWAPDLVIASDDPASQYVVAPHLKGDRLPVIFIGVNWTVDQYGYPFPNVTGQVEVELIRELVSELRRQARGPRVAILTGDTITDRKTVDYYRKTMGIEFSEVRLVASFARWKEAYRELQQTADSLVFRNNGGIEGWDGDEAERFVLEHTAVPSGSVSVHMGRWVLVSFSKDNAEFGEWAGKTALEILAGRSPSAIPLTANRRARLVLNMPLARKLRIVFPMEMIEQATFTNEP